MKKLFTSESVTKGHPDKVCDQIADAVLDELLRQDPLSRVACEVIAEPGKVHIMGEITSKAVVDYKEIARKVIRSIGYTDEALGFTDECEITESIHKQSPDISMAPRTLPCKTAHGPSDREKGIRGAELPQAGWKEPSDSRI